MLLSASSKIILSIISLRRPLPIPTYISSRPTTALFSAFRSYGVSLSFISSVAETAEQRQPSSEPYRLTMADHAEDDFFDGDIFIYRRGRQIPQHVTHVLIDESVDEIEDDAFYECRRLVQVDTHDGLRTVGKRAFFRCTSLRQINLKSATEIDDYAFHMCTNLESVEFGDRLETIGEDAFRGCSFLKHLKLPSIISIGTTAFCRCTRLRDVELSGRLETIGGSAFYGCKRLQRIAIPPKRVLFVLDFYQRCTHFK